MTASTISFWNICWNSLALHFPIAKRCWDKKELWAKCRLSTWRYISDVSNHQKWNMLESRSNTILITVKCCQVTSCQRSPRQHVSAVPVGQKYFKKSSASPDVTSMSIDSRGGGKGSYTMCPVLPAHPGHHSHSWKFQQWNGKESIEHNILKIRCMII